MDDHYFFCVLLCSTCSTPCCCIAVWTVESNYDFFRPICRNRVCISGLGISRQTGFNLEFPSPRWIACQGYELHPPFFRFCLETYKLLTNFSAHVILLLNTQVLTYTTQSYHIHLHITKVLWRWASGEAVGVAYTGSCSCRSAHRRLSSIWSLSARRSSQRNSAVD